jgi:hypothetical protein
VANPMLSANGPATDWRQSSGTYRSRQNISAANIT